MGFEKEPRFSEREVMELTMDEEEISLVNSWNSIFIDIAEISKVLNLSSSELSFSDEFGIDNKFFMRISVKDQKEDHEPELLAISIYSSPKKQKDDGLFLQMNSAQTSWENGRLNGLSITAQSFLPDGTMPFDFREISDSANQMLTKVKRQLDNPFSSKPQSDLMS